MEEYFYYCQLQNQDIDTMETRLVSTRIPLADVPFLMRALGFYPTEQEVRVLLQSQLTLPYRSVIDGSTTTQSFVNTWLFCCSWKTCKMRWSSAAMLRPETTWRTSIWRSSLSCLSTTDLPLALPDRSCAMPSRCLESQTKRADIQLTETNFWSYCRLEATHFYELYMW